VELHKFRNTVSVELSGGNKRKLSATIALLGRPKAVFLDEPSTGMDPVSRRFMWGLIQEVARSCSVLLTTHAMDECDALCERVAILSRGVLRCLGSPQHLKAKYSMGYTVEVKMQEPDSSTVRTVVAMLSSLATVTANNWDQASEMAGCVQLHQSLLAGASIDKAAFARLCVQESRKHALLCYLRHEFSNAELSEQIGDRISFRIMTDLPLGGMYEVLNQAKVQLHIEEYGASQTSLEQVFNEFASNSMGCSIGQGITSKSKSLVC